MGPASEESTVSEIDWPEVLLSMTLWALIRMRRVQSQLLTYIVPESAPVSVTVVVMKSPSATKRVNKATYFEDF
jgi:hypothetical protein